MSEFHFNQLLNYSDVKIFNDKTFLWKVSVWLNWAGRKEIEWILNRTTGGGGGFKMVVSSFGHTNFINISCSISYHIMFNIIVSDFNRTHPTGSHLFPLSSWTCRTRDRTGQKEKTSKHAISEWLLHDMNGNRELLSQPELWRIPNVEMVIREDWWSEYNSWVKVLLISNLV